MLKNTSALNTRPQFAFALLAVGTLLIGSAPAHLVAVEREALRSQASETLSFAIADQGNLALQSIRAESRESIRHWQLAPLPAPVAGTLVVADRF